MTSTLLSMPARTGPAAPDSQPVERCPLCDDPRGTPVHRLADPSGRIAGVFELRRCTGCGIVYVDPRPGDEALTRLYDEDFYFSTGWSYRALAAMVIDRGAISAEAWLHGGRNAVGATQSLHAPQPPPAPGVER